MSDEQELDPEDDPSWCDFCETTSLLGRVVFLNPTSTLTVCGDCVTVLWNHIQKIVITAHKTIDSDTRH